MRTLACSISMWPVLIGFLANIYCSYHQLLINLLPSIHRYYGWYADSGQLELIQHQLEENMDQWFGKYNMPVLISEYGADTVPGLHHDPPLVVCQKS